MKYLKSKNVAGVINMCLEYSGPIKLYQQYEIKQLHLPTLDIHEPTLSDMKQAIQFIDQILITSKLNLQTNENSNNNNNPIILIHCKGGCG